MAKKRKSDPLKNAPAIVARLLVFGGLIIYAPLVAWWNSLTEFTRTALMILGIVAILAGIILIAAARQYHRAQRRLAWENAMKVWRKNQATSPTSPLQNVGLLSDVELEKFAEQIYKKMGYQVKHTGQSGDHGIDVLLVNPENQIEIVQCKQWHKPVGKPQVRDLFGAMRHKNAVQGWLWAPTGFSNPAKQWAKGKEIVLVDEVEIGQLVEAAYNEK